MPLLLVEFLLTDKPVRVDIEFDEGSTLEAILPVIEGRLPDPGMFSTHEFFSSVIITHNGRIGDGRTLLKDGDQIKIFHLVDGG